MFLYIQLFSEEKGLDASTIKTVRHHIQNTFSVPVFSREEKDLIRDTTINAIHLRLQQRRRLP